MVCGFCSREQPFRDVCVCGATFGDAANKHYWEGGKGQRSTPQMNKNDPHKYRGLNKTQSQKSKRVGPKTQVSTKK